MSSQNGTSHEQKTALITGGGPSGMGLTVAQALAARQDWSVHVVDFNSQRREEVAKLSERLHFHKADVTDYASLSAAFQSVFSSTGQAPRLDFVFANAGVIESRDFYAAFSQDAAPGSNPPPEPDLRSIDVDLKGVILTCYLAQHYFRRSAHGGKGARLVLTASCGSLYPSYYSPMYTAAKHGVLGLLRAIAKRMQLEGIFANAICPGIVETNLVGDGGWVGFPQDLFTPADMVSKTVLHLVDGKDDLIDANGVKVSAEKLYGLSVEINLTNIYIRTSPEFCDEPMRKIMEATDPEQQKGGVIKDF
ncbi:hypothetical protein KC331_g11498 [Hortaea werneckii]|nr:hypothetical protein KC331_g11498 [Hortaea werneckii]KAI7696476.1 hypothetical protein KC353_g17516 [Hortaea werneckii]